MKKFEFLGKRLNFIEQKNIKGGNLPGDELDGCGTGISCDGKKEGDSCGTKTCLCEKNSSTDKTLYCSTQV